MKHLLVHVVVDAVDDTLVAAQAACCCSHEVSRRSPRSTPRETSLTTSGRMGTGRAGRRRGSAEEEREWKSISTFCQVTGHQDLSGGISIYK